MIGQANVFLCAAQAMHASSWELKAALYDSVVHWPCQLIAG